MGAQQALNLIPVEENLSENNIDLSGELPNEGKSEPETDTPKTTAQDSAPIQGSDGGRAQSKTPEEKP